MKPKQMSSREFICFGFMLLIHFDMDTRRIHPYLYHSVRQIHSIIKAATNTNKVNINQILQTAKSDNHLPFLTNLLVE